MRGDSSGRGPKEKIKQREPAEDSSKAAGGQTREGLAYLLLFSEMRVSL
jgi:hypothetical protein